MDQVKFKMSELSVNRYKTKHNEEKFTISLNAKVLELLLAGDPNVLAQLTELFSK